MAVSSSINDPSSALPPAVMQMATIAATN